MPKRKRQTTPAVDVGLIVRSATRATLENLILSHLESGEPVDMDSIVASLSVAPKASVAESAVSTVTTAKNAGAFEVLDDEMVIMILNFLQSTAKFPALVTNKCFLALRKDSRLWKELVLKIGPQSWHPRTNLLLPCSTAARLTTLIPTTHLKKLHIFCDKKFDMMQAKAFVAGLSEEAPVTDLAVSGDRLRGSQITKLITAKIGSKIQTLSVHKPDTATFYLKNSPNITSHEVTDGIDSSEVTLERSE